MIKYINLSNHKALKSVSLLDLGHLNVICGKNNSGKTTILEALLDKNCYGVGKEVGDKEWLISLFKPQTTNHSNPNPRYSIQWFENYIQGLIQAKDIWFSNDKKGIVDKILEAKSKDPNLTRIPRRQIRQIAEFR